jgi:acetoin utilization protein AcuB
MRVKYWMTPNVVTAAPNEGLRRAWTLLQEYDVRHLPVLEGDRLVGIVTDRDIRQALPSRVSALGVHELMVLLDRVTLREIMTKEIVTVSPDQSIPEAARLLVKHRIGALPVVDNGRLVGILTETDVLQAYLSLGDVSEMAPQPCWKADAMGY